MAEDPVVVRKAAILTELNNSPAFERLVQRSIALRDELEIPELSDPVFAGSAMAAAQVHRAGERDVRIAVEAVANREMRGGEITPTPDHELEAAVNTQLTRYLTLMAQPVAGLAPDL